VEGKEGKKCGILDAGLKFQHIFSKTHAAGSCPGKMYQIMLVLA